MNGKIIEYINSEMMRNNIHLRPELQIFDLSKDDKKVMSLFLSRYALDFKSWVRYQIESQLKSFLRELADELGQGAHPSLNIAVSVKSMRQSKTIEFNALAPHVSGLIVALINQITGSHPNYLDNGLLTGISQFVARNRKISSKQKSIVTRATKVAQLQDKAVINALIAYGFFKKDPS